MRPAELVTALLVVAWVLVGPSRLTPRWTLAAAAAVLLLATVAFGPWRWQLWPLGVAVLVIVPLSLLPLLRPGSEPRLVWQTGVLVLTLTLVTSVLAAVLPIPRFPLEDGSSEVGTMAFDLVDPDRSSASRTVPDTEPRRITVQAWYPTQDRSGERLRATDDPRAFSSAVGGFIGLPGWALRHSSHVRSAARVGASVSSDEPLPVVLALHGWGGFRLAQMQLLQQLAADGHLVLAIDHTHGAVAAQPVAGGVVPIDPALLPDGVPAEVYDAASQVLERMFTDDAHSLVAALRSGDAQVPPAVLATADLDRLVVLGHSTGGGAGIWFCAEDGGCRGFVGYDPWVEPLPPEVRASGPEVPWLAIDSGEWAENDNSRLLSTMVPATGAQRFTIDGTLHRDFTVQPLLSPLASRLGLSGELPARRTHEIVLELTRSYLADRLATGPGDPFLLEDPPMAEVSAR